MALTGKEKSRELVLNQIERRVARVDCDFGKNRCSGFVWYDYQNEEIGRLGEFKQVSNSIHLEQQEIIIAVKLVFYGGKPGAVDLLAKADQIS